MNHQLTAAAWKRRLAPTPKLVLLALADLVDENCECTPSVAQLVERVGVLDNTVHGAIARLEREGLLEVERRHGRVNVYRLRLAP